MKKIVLCISLLVLACGKKEKTEYIFPQSTKGDVSSLEVKILAQNLSKISLDDELIIETGGRNLAETKTTTLNVSCEAAGVNNENKKMRLSQNKKYRFLQLVPSQLISKKNLNLIKNFSCMFSFSFQKNRTKDVGPLVIDNTGYDGNLPLRRGAQTFPKDPKDVVLPSQVNDIQFDFPSGRAITTTLICDQFVSREDLTDIRYFQLAQLIYKGVHPKMAGAQNCRLVIEALDASEEIFISKSFVLVFNKENLVIDLSSGFSKMSRVSRGPLTLFTLVVTNPNQYPIKVEVTNLPQRVIWQPVHGVKNGANGGPVYVLKPNIKTLSWNLANFVLGPQQQAVLSASASMDVICVEGLSIGFYGPVLPLIGYLVELDSDTLGFRESFQDAKIGFSEYLLAGPLQPSFGGNKKWIAVDGIEYSKRINWFGNGITIYQRRDINGTEERHCTETR